MRFTFLPWLGAFACAVLGGCFLYTDPINRAPTEPRILRTAGNARNMSFIFEADCSDPDGDAVKFEWARTAVDDAHPCPAAPTPDEMPAPTFLGNPFTLMVANLDPFCVWLRATDSSGARSGPTTLLAAAVNAPPVAVLTRQQPGGNAVVIFPLYSNFRFSAAQSLDPDGDATLLTRAWTLASFPDQAQPRFDGHCATTDPTDMAACFHADVPGGYQLVLTVTDGASMPGPESMKTATVMVADDAPPCLIADGTSIPARVADPTEAQTFTVTVADDGDPWPRADAANGYPRFTWGIRNNGGAWQTATGYDATLELAAGQLSVGDRTEVRVQVADRVTRSLAACGDAPTCELAAGCAQRLTWTVEFR